MTIPVKSYIFSGPMIISVKSHTLVLAQFMYYRSNMIISVKSHIPGICWNSLGKWMVFFAIMMEWVERNWALLTTLELILSRKIVGVPEIKCLRIMCSRIRCVSIRCPRFKCPRINCYRIGCARIRCVSKRSSNISALWWNEQWEKELYWGTSYLTNWTISRVI